MDLLETMASLFGGDLSLKPMTLWWKNETVGDRGRGEGGGEGGGNKGNAWES